jgi:DNA-binding response OmpR family regulator
MTVRLLTDGEPYDSYVETRDPRGSLVFLNGSAVEDGTSPEYRHADLYVIPVGTYLAFPPEKRAGIMAFAYGTASHMSEAFAAGCTDYLRDPWPLQELAARAARLETMRFHLGTEAMELNGPVLRFRTGKRDIGLGELERRFLRVLLMNGHNTVPREAISWALWGRMDCPNRGIDVHAARLRKRFDTLVPGSGRSLKACRGMGYRLLTLPCG